ncbi:glycoside hydrolase family 68 protein [uncultured Cocleimonas sp.]|uniref:glycoside hydrolase family 68 protein n=1 Tax=uncultured Cocleimonas sp. TaxID=1051587 RepID=UPI0026185DC1|nr:glycoside hydrolase family 68 protein [uncultured Cocleimonas sp.]
MLALDDKWVWDYWLVRNPDDNLWHVFFLQADKSIIDPELRHWNVSFGHATSTDLIQWDYLGTCFQPANSPSWDDKTTWTGSVVQNEDGLWHLFYTGSSEEENGLIQRIGHATSSDLHHWVRVDNGFCLDLDARWYDSEYRPDYWHDRAMRDPWVMRDPEGSGWMMFFTARVPGIEEANNAGAIGLARSNDLYKWTLSPPVFQGGFGQLEVPQVIQISGKWYCLFCNSGDHWSKAYEANMPGGKVSGTHYLMADNINGPWTIAPGKFLDGGLPCRRYVGKLLETDAGLRYMSFWHDTAEGEFIGTLSDPVEVKLTNGLLELIENN